MFSLRLLGWVLIGVLCFGCAVDNQIRNKGTISVTSEPSGATLTLKADLGDSGYYGTTPLQTSWSSYRPREGGIPTYTLIAELPGYEPQTRKLTYSQDGHIQIHFVLNKARPVIERSQSPQGIAQLQERRRFNAYIENFEVAGDLPQGRYVNVERQIPMMLTTILRGKGVKVIINRKDVDKDTVIIRGMFSFRENDPQKRTGYQGLPMDSITIDIVYEGARSGADKIKMDYRRYPDEMLDSISDVIAVRLGQK